MSPEYQVNTMATDILAAWLAYKIMQNKSIPVLHGLQLPALAWGNADQILVMHVHI